MKNMDIAVLRRDVCLSLNLQDCYIDDIPLTMMACLLEKNQYGFRDRKHINYWGEGVSDIVDVYVDAVRRLEKMGF